MPAAAQINFQAPLRFETLRPVREPTTRPSSDEGARVNTICVSLLASCQLHAIDPWAYLRDIFCLLRTWPPDRFLELAPAFWKQTIQQQDTQERLAANVFHGVTGRLLLRPASIASCTRWRSSGLRKRSRTRILNSNVVFPGLER
jgi:hypothetical protein